MKLDIDGKNVVSQSFAGVEKCGMMQANPSGIVLLKSSALSDLTIGYPSPLRFEREVKLSVKVNEPGIVQIVANVVHGAA